MTECRSSGDFSSFHNGIAPSQMRLVNSLEIRT
jgi:hypothetical protein